ncbi:Ion transport protein-domain-containing protein [Geopyxis carbonaria]|nr:Ion transport protein-domain-containing protein [Geopyxis carbonaria]
MASYSNYDDTSEPIPLQDLSTSIDASGGHTRANLGENIGRQRSLLQGGSFGAEIGRRISAARPRNHYDRLGEHPNEARITSPSEVPDLQMPVYEDGYQDIPSASAFRQGFEEALGRETDGKGGSWLPPRNLADPVSGWGAGSSDRIEENDSTGGQFHDDFGNEEDTAHLADPVNQQSQSGFHPKVSHAHNKRLSTHSVRFAPGSSLGDDLQSAEEGVSRSMSSKRRSRSLSDAKGTPSRSGSLSKVRSLSPGASPVRRVSVAVQNMSQRVVNLSNDPEAIEQTIRRRGSNKSNDAACKRASLPNIEIHIEPENEDAEEKPSTPLRVSRRDQRPWHEQSNPLKGNTLRIFSPNNKLRLLLCDVLIHPATEPLILLLILVQTILLTIDSAPSVYDDPRAKSWGTSSIDYALLVLFSIYSIEIFARCVVSGFVLNPRRHDDPNARGGLRRRLAEKGQRLLSPRRNLPDRTPSPTRMDTLPSLLRSITTLNLEGGPAPATVQSEARFRLARRAFLRHSFNRLDFLAVCSYWISLGLCITGLEAERHLYIFRMMSCLRILRLLGITSGTSVILRSLKKAAPLLVHVAFLIGFFWLVFAVIGVQSFKGSLQRSCVWVDPAGIQSNYTQQFQFCGGYIDSQSGEEKPYVHLDGVPGAKDPKGYICPVNSICVSDQNPYGGTISFDNIVQSLELVFVVMTANTFSDLLYYTADSDYLAAALFFICGIIILAFWLANLLIAVITSSFQVIREESRKSAFSAQDDTSSIIETDERNNRKPNTLKQYYDLSHHFWIGVIAGGLLAQSFRSSDMSKRAEVTINNIEVAVTVLLFIEILLRFAADWRRFFKMRRNWVDLGFALMTSIILLPPVRGSGRVYDWLTLFQILRIYRLVWAVPVTRNLLAKVLGNVSGLSNLLFFVILLTFLCALFAVQIVRGDIPQEFDGETTPISFHTIFNAFLGMYQIFSSEGWTSILYMTTQVQAPYHIAWISAMFFIGWFILGNFIVLNMFIAVIQENFDVSEDEKRMYQVKTFLQNKSYKAPSQGIGLTSIFSRKNKGPQDHSKQAAFEMLTKQAVVESFLDEGEQHNRQSLNRAAPMAVAAAVENLHMQEEKKQRFFQRWYGKIKEYRNNRDPNPFYNFQTRSVADLAPTALAQEVVTEQDRRKKAQREYLAKHPNYNVSLFIFRPTNPLRRLCQRMVGPSRASIRYDGLPPYSLLSYAFSLVVYCAIVAMVILACVTTPLYQKEYFEKHGASSKNWFTLADAGFVALFTLESIIKVVADGLIWTPNAYLRGSWGIIDCIVLITLWISVISSLRKQDEITRAVGAFKALRALRLLNISGTAQDTFHSVVIVGGRKILSAAFVSLSLIIPFAIYGVNLFSGRMDACNDGSDNISNLTDCIHEYASAPFGWDVLAPRAVDNPYFNFDNFGTSLFILFQIVSQEGWTGVMFNAQNIVGKGMQPRPFNSQLNSIFFLAFNLLGAVFVLTLFVSVFMRNYTEQTGVAFLTADQRTWLELRKLLRQVRPSKRPNESPNSAWKSWCYQRATHKHGWWQRTLTVLLMVHGVLLLLEYHPSPESLDRVRDWLFLGLTLCFVGNLAVRIIGLTWVNFLKSKWDLYALVSVSGTLISTLLLLAGYSTPAFIQLQKLFLVSIVIMLIPRNDQLDQLFKTAAASLSSIGNLMATWFVLFLVYAIALTQTFGLTRIGQTGNGNMNFRTVPKALILLFRMTCGEGWNEIMSDYEVLEPQCVRGPTFFETDCGSQAYARALFVSWNIVSMYIFVSMFISLIFESFSYVYQRSGDSSSVSREEIRKFKQAWSKFDPDGSGYIPKDKFPRLLGNLSGIFAMRIYEEPFTVHSILDDVRVDSNAVKGINRQQSGIVHGIDLEALNRRINQIPIHKIRRQRHMFTLFFEECLVSANKDLGVSFESVLLILAHYKIINDNKSLRLEEYLRRKYRLQRVEEQVQRNCVTNFFLTLYWSKRFKDLKSGKVTPSSGGAKISISEVPQIFVDYASSTSGTVPLIRVDDESDIHPLAQSLDPLYFQESHIPSPKTPPPLDLGGSSGFGSSGRIGFEGIDPFGSTFSDESPSGLRQRPGRRTPPNSSPMVSAFASSNVSPMHSPSHSPIASPRLHPSQPGEGLHSPGSSSSEWRIRTASEVAPQIVLEALDSSEWRDQIRSFIEEQQINRQPSRAGEFNNPR